MNKLTKITLKLDYDVKKNATYRIMKLTGDMIVHTSKGNFRCGDYLTEQAVNDLACNRRDYLLTVVPA